MIAALAKAICVIMLSRRNVHDTGDLFIAVKKKRHCFHKVPPFLKYLSLPVFRSWPGERKGQENAGQTNCLTTAHRVDPECLNTDLLLHNHTILSSVAFLQCRLWKASLPKPLCDSC